VNRASLTGLARVIKTGDLRHPIVITPENVLLDGERRLMAALKADVEYVRVAIVGDIRTASGLMAATLADDELAEPMTYIEKMRVVDQLCEFDEPAAARRRSARAAMAGSSQKSRDVLFQIRPILAEAVGIGESAYGRIRRVWDFTKSDDPLIAKRAYEAMSRLDDPDLGGGIARVLRELLEDLGMADQRPHIKKLPVRDQVTTAAGQRHIYEGAAQALQVVVLGLSQAIEPHPDLGVDERRRWLGQYEKARVALNHISKTMRASLDALTPKEDPTP
jgi:hypothetical protein